MKNIDTLLNEHVTNPARPLRAGFTASVIASLQADPTPRRSPSVVRLLKKRFSLLSLGLLLVAGSAAAVATTFKPAPSDPSSTPLPKVNQTVTKQLSDGSRIVGYHLQSCHFFSGPTHVDMRSNENVYYAVKPGSTLTDTQLSASLEGVCESMVNSDNMGTIMQSFDREGVTPYDEFGTMNMLVEDITPNSITVRIDPAYDPVKIAAQDKAGLTYTQFFQGLKVYNQGKPIAYSNIKAGDTVQLLMGHTPGYSYTIGVAQEATPSQDILYAIMKVPPLAADPTLFFLSVGRDLQQVKPCASSASGYCVAVPK